MRLLQYGFVFPWLTTRGPLPPRCQSNSQLSTTHVVSPEFNWKCNF